MNWRIAVMGLFVAIAAILAWLTLLSTAPNSARMADPSAAPTVAALEATELQADGLSMPVSKFAETSSVAASPASLASSELEAQNSNPISSSYAELPADTPLHEVIDALIAAADAGDQKAACRLAWDLDLCHHAARFAKAVNATEIEAAQAAPGSADEADSAKALIVLSTWHERAQRICQDLPTKYVDQAAARMLQSARLGHPKSMARFALALPWPETLTLDDLDVMTAYRTESLNLLKQAADAGEPTGLYGLFRALAAGELQSQHGRIPIDADPILTVAAGMALSRFADRQTSAEATSTINALIAAMSPEQVQAARQQAAVYSNVFARQPPRDFAGGVFKPDMGATCVPSADD